MSREVSITRSGSVQHETKSRSRGSVPKFSSKSKAKISHTGSKTKTKKGKFSKFKDAEVSHKDLAVLLAEPTHPPNLRVSQHDVEENPMLVIDDASQVFGRGHISMPLVEPSNPSEKKQAQKEVDAWYDSIGGGVIAWSDMPRQVQDKVIISTKPLDFLVKMNKRRVKNNLLPYDDEIVEKISGNKEALDILREMVHKRKPLNVYKALGLKNNGAKKIAPPKSRKQQNYEKAVAGELPNASEILKRIKAARAEKKKKEKDSARAAEKTRGKDSFKSKDRSRTDRIFDFESVHEISGDLMDTIARRNRIKEKREQEKLSLIEEAKGDPILIAQIEKKFRQSRTNPLTLQQRAEKRKAQLERRSRAAQNAQSFRKETNRRKERSGVDAKTVRAEQHRARIEATTLKREDRTKYYQEKKDKRRIARILRKGDPSGEVVYESATASEEEAPEGYAAMVDQYALIEEKNNDHIVYPSQDIFPELERKMSGEENQDNEDQSYELEDSFQSINMLDMLKDLNIEDCEEEIKDDVEPDENVFASWMNIIKDYFSAFVTRVGALGKRVLTTLVSFGTLAYGLYSATTPGATMLAVMNFVTQSLGQMPDKLLNVIKACAQSIWDKLCNFCKRIRTSMVSVDHESSYVDSLSMLFSKVMNSEVLQLLRNMILTVLSLKMFECDVVSKITPYFGKLPKVTKLSDLIGYILSGLEILVRAGTALVGGASLSDVFLSNDPYTKFIEDATELLYYWGRGDSKVYVGLPVTGHMCIKEYVHKAQILLEVGEPLKKKILSRAPYKKAFLEAFDNLRNSVSAFQQRLYSGVRPAPYAICLVGMPGIGKSLLLNLPAYVMSKIKNREFSETQIYHRIKTSDYWEGYQPLSQPYIHYSEVGGESVNIAKMNMNLAMTELLSVIDNQTFSCDMAFDKSGTYALPEMVLIDTNNETLHAEVQNYSAAALLRRFIFVSVVVRDEFRIAEEVGIDHKKSFQYGGNLLDRYFINVYTYGTGKNGKPHKKFLLCNANIDEYVEYLTLDIVDHIEHQMRLSQHDHYGFANEIVGDCLYEPLEDEKVDAQPEIGDYSMEPKDGVTEVEPNLVYAEDSKSESTDVDSAIDDLLSVFDDEDSVLVQEGVETEAYVRNPLQWFNQCITDFMDEKIERYGVVFTIVFLNAILSVMDILVPQQDLMQFQVYKLVIAVTYMLFYGTWGLSQFFICFLFVSINISQVLRMTLESKVVEMKDYIEDARRRLRAINNPAEVYNPFMSSSKEQMLQYLGVAMFGITALMGAKSAVSFTRRYLKRDKVDYESKEEIEQGMNFNSVRRIIKINDEQKVWNEVEPRPPQVHKGNISQLHASMQNQVKLVVVRSSDCPNGKVTHIFGVKDMFYLINKHNFGDQKSFEIGFIKSPEDEPETYHVIRDYRQVGQDLCVICIKTHRVKDCSKHILRGQPAKAAQGMFNGEIVNITTCKKVVADGVTYNDVLQYTCKHNKGMCGKFIVSYVTGTDVALVGIHMAGVQGHEEYSLGYASPLNAEAIDLAIKELNDTLMPLVAESLNRGFVTEAPTVKSPFRYLHLPNLKYYGKEEGPVLVNKKSSLLRSPYYEEVAPFLTNTIKFEQSEEYFPPVMRPFKKGEQYISPYNVALCKMNNTPPQLDFSVMKFVVRKFTDHIVKHLKDEGVVKLSPVDLKIAINGEEENPFFRRMNARTSGGHGFPGGKERYIPLKEGSETERVPTEELEKSVYDIIQRYLNQETCEPIYTVQLKDEPRLSTKVATGRTRLFYMSPMDFLAVSRMFLGPLYTLMVQYGKIFKTAVGVNMMSNARYVVDILGEKSLKNIIEGDYGGFDISNPVGIAWMASTVVHDVLKELGYSDKALSVVRGILTDNMFPVIEMNRDLFSKPGLQPSGKYATAEDNSLRGVLMMMYAWYSQESTRTYDFFEHVSPITYGDDVLASVTDDMAHAFNANVYQKLCRNLYNMEFTTAAKGNVMSDFMDITQVTFLRRSFKWSDRFSKYLAPLNPNSLIKSIQWIMPSKVISESEQSLATMQSALYEIWLHSSESENLYNVCRDQFIEWLDKAYGMREIASAELPYFVDVAKNISDEIADEPHTLSTVECESRKRGREYTLYGLVSIHPLKESKVVQLLELCAELSNSTKWHSKLLEEYTLLRARFLQAHELLLQEEKQLEFLPYSMDERARLYANLADSVATIEMLDAKINSLQRPSVFVSYESEIREGSVDHVDIKENLYEVYGNEPDCCDYQDYVDMNLGQNEVLELGDFFSRPVNIFSGEFNEGSLSFWLEPWQSWSNQPSVIAKLRNYAFFRGTLCLRIVVTGTQFHMGKLLFSYQPLAAANANLRYISDIQATATASAVKDLKLCYLSQSPYKQYVDVRMNEPAFIMCPYIASKPVARLFNNSAAVISTHYTDLTTLGRLYIESVGDILMSNGTTQIYSMQIFAWVDDIHLGCPTGTHVTVSTESDERKTGPVEKAATAIADISQMMMAVPIIRPLAMASTLIFRGTSMVASWFGWSRPAMDVVPKFVKNQPYMNSAVCIGGETVQKIAVDPLQEVTVDPRVVGREEDELVIQNISKIESYLSNFYWGVEDPTMETPIWKCLVTPCLSASVNLSGVNYEAPTAMAFAVAPFSYWRGTITYRFEFVVSSFHRGKIAIVYEPNVPQSGIILPTLTMNKQYMLVVDLQETQMIEFDVDWAFPKAWANVMTSNGGYGDGINHGVSITLSDWNRFNGMIAIYPVTRLVSAGVEPVRVNVYVRCDDLAVQRVDSVNMPTNRATPPIGLESMDRDQAVTRVVINETGAQFRGASQHQFGENVFSFRALLKRYVTILDLTVPVSGMGNTVSKLTDNLYPDQNPKYGDTLAKPMLTTYLPYAFIGMRGGARKRVHYYYDITDDVAARRHTYTERITATLGPISGRVVPVGTFTSSLPVLAQRGSISYIPTTNGGIEVELPYYSPNLFCLSFTDGYDSNSQGFVNTWSNHYSVDNKLGAFAHHIVVDHAAADDFTFFGYQGAPLYTRV